MTSAVTLLWSPADDGYALIVDGVAEVHDDMVVIRPTRAVLHRPRPEQSSGPGAKPEGSCAADCLEIALP
jgi:hypothetical protein